MTRPKHLVVNNGHLYDTRKAHWYISAPLRAKFQWQTPTIETTHQLKAALRAGKYAWPGKYRLAFVTAKRTFLSFEAVRKELESVIRSIRQDRTDGWRVIGLGDVEHLEDPVYCAHSDEQIGGPPAFDAYEFYMSVVKHGNGEPTDKAYKLAEELVADNYDYATVSRIVIDRGMMERLD